MTTLKVELTSPRGEDSYVQSYQTYLKQKNSYQSLLMDISTPSTQTKNTKELIVPEECKVCSIVKKPGDLYTILNQGLYYKYTSSQDFFYSRDITALLENKRQAFCIRYQDDLIFDEEKEHLKVFFKRKQTKSMMDEIKQFYCQFRSYPKVYEDPFFKIMNNHLAKHRRIEYVKVFQQDNPSDTSSQDNKRLSTANQFEFMQMLGETFLKENNKSTSISIMDKVLENKPEKGRETELYMEEVAMNFDLLKTADQQKKKGSESSKGLHNNHYVLYSRNDSEAAEEMLRDMLYDFKKLDTKTSPRKGDKERETPKKLINQESLRKVNKESLEGELIRKKKISATDRPRSSSKNMGLKKLHIDQTSILKEYMKEVENGRNHFDSVIEKGLRTSREHSIEGRTLRPESGKSPRQNSSRNRHSINTQRSIRGTNLLIKFTPDDLKDSVFDRDSLLSKVNQMRSNKNKLIKLNSEEWKHQTPTSAQPFFGNDASLTYSSKQIKISLQSPSTLKKQSPLAIHTFRNQDDRSSKTPLIRPEIIIPTKKARESRPAVRERDLFIGFESNRSSKSKESRLGIESPGVRTVKASKSNPKLFTKLIEKDMPMSVRESKNGHEKINLRNVIKNLYSDTCRSSKKPSFELEVGGGGKTTDRDRGVYLLDKRSMSSGILKPRPEVSTERKKETGGRKGNQSISRNHQQNISDINSKKNNSSSKSKNTAWLKLAEVYLQNAKIQRIKSKSNGNTQINTPNTSRAEISAKFKKKPSMEFEVTESRIKGRKKSPLVDDRDITEFYSPKTTRNVINRDKSPKKSPVISGIKHIRYASRG